MNRKLKAFGQLLKIMDELREQCPWDKKQTYETLRKLTIEETYELADAIISKRPDDIKKELGDMLLHIVFYARIGSEKDGFDIADVIEELIKKLIFRHPHIYSNIEANDDEQVKKNWEALKLKEGKKTVLGGIPKSLPAMVKANRIQEKVRGVGFDWEEKEQIWDKVSEELGELQDAVRKKERSEKIEEEFGDLIFSVINAARLYSVDPEIALERTNRKFIKRFNFLEKETISKGKSLHNMSLAEMDKIWEKAKKNEIQ
ncbi:MAG: nucleoside triphosphate pyrophosphohydrolase [Bacteroidetes bacterium]|nr:nucleoside triphosphate pyrophosphohydrolase [Bacteroidota bacterium]